MANERGKSLDKTHLSIDQAEERGFIHRDYIAHCLRWSHVAKYLHQQNRYKIAHILDIGCGKEVPLAKMLYTSKMSPDSGTYLGIDANVDINKSGFKFGKFPITTISGVFPAKLDEMFAENPGFGFDCIVCFEVAEHVEPAATLAILTGIKRYLNHGGMAFISTPCYSHIVGAAANHVNEMSHEAFGSLIEHVGLYVESVYGTFASIKDYQHLLSNHSLDAVFDKLREYYDSNYLATVFAPMFPQHSRNCLWRITHQSKDFPVHKYAPLKTLLDANHSSSTLWTSFIESETSFIESETSK